MGFELYQYQICPFCNKVKTVLDFFKIPYSVVEVNPLTKAEIKFSKDYRKVPIARLEGGEVVNDSGAIVDRVKDLIQQKKLRPSTEVSAFFSEDGTRWADWADKKLAVLLFPNITRNFSEAYQAFTYVQVGQNRN